MNPVLLNIVKQYTFIPLFVSVFSLSAFAETSKSGVTPLTPSSPPKIEKPSDPNNPPLPKIQLPPIENKTQPIVVKRTIEKKDEFEQNKQPKPAPLKTNPSHNSTIKNEPWFILKINYDIAYFGLAFVILILCGFWFFRVKKMNSDNISSDEQRPSEPVLISPPPSEWLIVGHSAIGKDHIKNGTPCQDSFYIERINSQWGIAVCCDGAGSAAHSEIGSQFVAEKTAKTLAYAVEQHHWRIDNQLPTEQEWKDLSVPVFYKVYKDLSLYAQENNRDIKSLACTVIAVIYSPMGLLVAHIGDGRAAYCNKAGEWQSIMTPFKGEEANQTIFITSAIWQETDKYIESRVIKETPYGFSLMSDGCEGFAFETYVNTAKIEGQIKVRDMNRPFDKFYAYATERLKHFYLMKDSKKAIDEDWKRILEEGTNRIKYEPDDKTMILGIWV